MKGKASIYIKYEDCPGTLFESGPIRLEVAKFAIEMERVLTLNDHKGGWKKDKPATDPEAPNGNTLQFFQAKLSEEYMELRHEICRPVLRPDAIRREAADVANIAMMIADNWGELLK